MASQHCTADAILDNQANFSLLSLTKVAQRLNDLRQGCQYGTSPNSQCQRPVLTLVTRVRHV